MAKTAIVDLLRSILQDYGLAIDVLAAETPWVFPTENEVLALHRAIIERSGGRFGLRSRDLLLSALHRPLGLVAYEDEPPSAGRLAACLMQGLVKNHAFVDGNKRTAFAAGVLFLRKSGLDLVTKDPAQWHATMIDLATDRLGLDELSHRLDCEIAEWPEATAQPSW